jgi:hypothetical protein
MNEPKPGEVWRHHNGQEYEVLLITNVSPLTVVYKNVRIGSLVLARLAPQHDPHEGA